MMKKYYKLEAAFCRATMRAHALQARAYFVRDGAGALYFDNYIRSAVTMRDLARTYDRMANK